MAAVKFGWDQRNSPAPLMYRRASVVVIVIMPILVSYLHSFPIPDLGLHIIDQTALFVCGVIKGLETVLGNGQRFVPSNQTIEKQEAEKSINSPK